MKDKASYIKAINIVNMLQTQQARCNPNKEGKSRKTDLRYFRCILVTEID